MIQLRQLRRAARLVRENWALSGIIVCLLGAFTWAAIDSLQPAAAPPSVRIRPHLKSSGEELVVAEDK
jgi:hypothetical protein